ncbi:LysR family transcriptional regulator [Hydrogenophaga sp. OTU3427]|uniref:LysR family transcriptional regulator n=1 Tax=Hydrogenophaga sp. OTU3427 TaxID=3043856 RepID=UPI00313E638F
MHINDLDLNLLRLFDEVYRAGNVSRAAERLGLTQPAVSQGLTRLRLLIHDPLFVRSPGGVRPTPKAQAMAEAVGSALAMLTRALSDTAAFDPARSQRLFSLHMSDIGEARFLPELMAALRAQAPHVRVATRPVPHGGMADALDSGAIDFAFGYLPQVKDTQRAPLVHDRYIVLMRAAHPRLEALRRLRPAALLKAMQQLDFVAVRSHTDTLRLLQQEGLQERLRLTTEHFMVLPAIVRATDLCVVMPRNIAQGFVQGDGCAVVAPPFAGRDFVVDLHWSRRFEGDPAHRWFRDLARQLFTG